MASILYTDKYTDRHTDGQTVYPKKHYNILKMAFENIVGKGLITDE